MPDDLTTNERVKSLGFTTKPAPKAGLDCKHIMDKGKIVYTGDCYDVNNWLKGVIKERSKNPLFAPKPHRDQEG